MSTLINRLSDMARRRILSSESNPLQAVEMLVDEAIDRGELAPDQQSLVQSEVHSRLSGYGVIQPLLDDPTIEEIWINAPDRVYASTGGRSRRLDLQIESEQLVTIVERMLRHTGRRIDRSSPFVDASLEDGSRVHVVIPDITREHWSLNIRKFPTRVLSLDDLVIKGSLSVSQSRFLSDAIKSGKNVLVSGATQAGKTTMLCALLNELPRSERIVTVEETFEIRIEDADWVALQTRGANLEGGGEVSLRRLVKESLRMRPDRIVVGEVREAESFDLLIALNSGLPGLCTIHANSAADAITKLCTLPLLAGQNISSEFVKPTVASCIDLVVHCRLQRDGSRRVEEIARVGWNNSRATLELLEVIV